MTFQEFIRSCDREKVAEAVVRLHPEMQYQLDDFKKHYDIMASIEPVFDPKANSQECHVSMEVCGDDEGAVMTAYPIEGDLWSATACKEMVIDDDVKASPEEIAACCLWHTSFYGFTFEQLEETHRRWREEHEVLDRLQKQREDPKNPLGVRYGNCFMPVTSVVETLQDASVHDGQLIQIDGDDLMKLMADDVCQITESIVCGNQKDRMSVAVADLKKQLGDNKIKKLALYVVYPTSMPLLMEELVPLMEFANSLDCEILWDMVEQDYDKFSVIAVYQTDNTL